MRPQTTILPRLVFVLGAAVAVGCSQAAPRPTSGASAGPVHSITPASLPSSTLPGDAPRSPFGTVPNLPSPSIEQPMP